MGIVAAFTGDHEILVKGSLEGSRVRGAQYSPSSLDVVGGSRARVRLSSHTEAVVKIAANTDVEVPVPCFDLVLNGFAVALPMSTVWQLAGQDRDPAEDSLLPICSTLSWSPGRPRMVRSLRSTRRKPGKVPGHRGVHLRDSRVAPLLLLRPRVISDFRVMRTTPCLPQRGRETSEVSAMKCGHAPGSPHALPYFSDQGFRT